MATKPYKPATKAVTAQVEKALRESRPLPSGIRLDFSSRTPIQVPNPAYAAPAPDEDSGDPSGPESQTPPADETI